ncbi:hypothetical protein [uncultured Nostoc sp.]|uniref:hypothetical protein n=1 Tax=uncultured Nostoc sp. TaxID=340711 RepID=UPI0035CB99E0
MLTSQQIEQSDVKVDLYICNSSLDIGRIIEVWQTCFTVDWSGEIKCYFWERDDQVIGELALAQPAAGIAPQHLIDKFFSQGETLKAIEDNQPQLCTKCFQVVAKSYTCDKCSPIECTQQSNHIHCPSCESPLIKLNDGCGVCGWIPENFLEERNEGVGLKQSSKRRQRKGCLYKYIENKKLKSGAIASYPRVIGHRHPDNPTHWRWGFNWEEKVDGEWKGRSIGSIPVGAIALIQSMQNEGVSLEEIIGFIRRAKAKK